MEDFRYKRGEILEVSPSSIHYKDYLGVVYEVIESKPVATTNLPPAEARAMKMVR